MKHTLSFRALLVAVFFVVRIASAQAPSPSTTSALAGQGRDMSAPSIPAVFADERGDTFGLDDAVRAMLRGHPLLSAARAQHRAASFDVVSAGLWTNPVVSLRYTRSAGFTTYDPVIGYAEFGVQQQIETSDVPGARRRAMEFEREATRADGLALQQSLIFDVRAAFVSLAGAYARLNVLRETLSDLERAHQIVRARVEAGATPRYDASRIAIALADARAAVADAEADVLRARSDLDVAVGPLAATLQGVPRFDLQANPPLPSLSSMLAELPRARADLVAATERARAARAQIDVARRSVFPGVALYAGGAFGGGVGLDNAGTVTGRQVDWVVGVTLPLPVVDRGQGSVPAAQHRAIAASDLAEALLVNAQQRVRALYAEVLRRRAALEEYRSTGAAAAGGMRREAEAGYREGRLSILELVDAYTSFRDARLRLVELAVGARLAEVQLGRAAGLSQ